MHSTDPILLNFNGVDRPGITASLAQIFYEEKARIVDIGQSVLNGHLILSIIVEIPNASQALRRAVIKAAELHLSIEVRALTSDQRLLGQTRSQQNPWLVTLLGEKLEENSSISKLTHFFAEKMLNIREIHTLSEGSLKGIEFLIEATHSTLLPPEIRGEILEMAHNIGVDIAVQKNDIFRKNRRLVCMDVDSTFVQMEVIDELARLKNCADKVIPITEAAMRGELDFNEALRRRVALLEGLPLEKAMALLEGIPLSPGAERFVKVLKKLGFKMGLVSGGFSFFVDHLKNLFGFDFAYSNELEVMNGKLTGKVKGTIVNAERKAQILRDVSHVYGWQIEQSIAIGDGANDRLLLENSGLGIAFKAKPKLQAIADLSLNRSGLDSVLYLMGFHETDLHELT